MKKNVALSVFTALSILTLLVIGFPGAGAAQSGTPPQVNQADHVPGELVIGLQPGQDGPSIGMERLQTLSKQVNADITEQALDQSFVLLRFNSDQAAQSAKDILARQPGVAYVEENVIFQAPPIDFGFESSDLTATYVPNDPSKFKEWQLDKTLYYQTAAPETTKVPCIVVIDSGVDYNHPDLSGKVYKGKDTIDNDLNPMDIYGHGTHVAGIAAAKTGNKVGIAGMSPKSNILAIRVLNASGSGTATQVANGILWANGATSAKCGGQDPKIYNMSLGSATRSTAVTSAIKAAVAKGRLVVAAAGNNDSTTKNWPAAEPGVFAVAATEENDRRAYFSSYDTAAAPWVDIAAPGYGIYSTYLNKTYTYMNGTSMATPIAAGVAAQVWAKYPTMTYTQVVNKITSTGDATGGFLRSAIKRVNLYRALGGTGLFIQGRIFNPKVSGPLSGATVTIKNAGTGQTICTIVTKTAGFYTCKVPSKVAYTVRIAKPGFIAQQKKLTIKGTVFNYNLSMAPIVGNTTTDTAWTVTITWKGWQPFKNPGREMDLWLVEPTAPSCYTAWLGSTDPNVLTFTNSEKIGQTEIIAVKSNKGGAMQIWATIWDSGSYWTDGRITGTGLEARIYYKNRFVSQVIVPTTPTTNTSDNWYIGSINLDTNKFTKTNKIMTDSSLPACVQVTP